MPGLYRVMLLMGLYLMVVQINRSGGAVMASALMSCVIQGHLNYYAVTGNGLCLDGFVYRVAWYWHRSLRRRSQRSRMTSAVFWRLASRFLPRVRILHPLPMHRFDAITRGRSPVR